MKKWIISTIFIFALIFTTGNTFANDNDDDENNDNLAHDEELNVSVNQSVTNDNTNNNLNKNSNDVDIKIENNPTQAQTVNIAAAPIPQVLPATGLSPVSLVLMVGAIPLGLRLRRYKIQ